MWKKHQSNVKDKMVIEVIILVICCIFFAEYANGGGTRVLEETIEFSGGYKNMFKPNSRVSISFDMEDYTYGSNEYGYTFFAAIPESSIDSNQVTLSQISKGKIFYTLLKSPMHDEGGLIHIHLVFDTPSMQDRYILVYSRYPMFRKTKIHSSDQIATAKEAHGGIFNYVRMELLNNSVSFEKFAKFIVSQSEPPMNTLTVYLRANGKNPAFESKKISGGIVNKPLELSWYIGKEFKLNRENVLFRYKIFPVDKMWSAWTKQKSVKYHFLPRGTLNFRVEAKYSSNGDSFLSQAARFNFVLTEHFVAKANAETIVKSPTGKTFTEDGKIVETNLAFNEVYKNSYALLIGIHKFDDKLNFKEFPSEKIERDVVFLGEALENNGFIVKKLFKDRLEREEIVTAMEDLVNRSSENDRLFIYFSTHGFADRKFPSDGYIATSNCNFFKPTVNCLPLSDIEKQANRALTGQKVRQVLIAVDSCFSGLGVISKAAGVPNYSKLAVVPGAYMLTAGMENQQAEIDPELKMSTFTHFLSEGLKGKANMFDKNGIITLTELFLYTQYNVAKQSNSRQIPMLGRLRGSGEMLFKPKYKEEKEEE
jgi:hypothetical protein